MVQTVSAMLNPSNGSVLRLGCQRCPDQSGWEMTVTSHRHHHADGWLIGLVDWLDWLIGLVEWSGALDMLIGWIGLVDWLEWIG